MAADLVEPDAHAPLSIDGELTAFGPYRIDDKIAGGGMAEVYKVYHEARPNDPLALKLIRPDKHEEGSFRHMLVDEAKIAGRLRHPNIARVLGLHEAEGQLGLILEYVDGIDLVQAQAALRERSSRFTIPVAVYVLRQALEGLDFAHNVRDESGEPLNIVHRDVSPGNIMIDVLGRVRIVDWGIARARRRDAWTDVGQVKGKFRYMAPEQITGKNVGPYTDVYAAAITFWEIMAGRRVYDELDVPKLMMVVSRGDAPRLEEARGDVSPGLAAVYARATERNPEKRYASAREMADALDALDLRIDAAEAKARLASLPSAARLLDGRKGYERAVLIAKSAATEGDLEGALLRALEEPDRVEHVDVDWKALDAAERQRAARRSSSSGR